MYTTTDRRGETLVDCLFLKQLSCGHHYPDSFEKLKHSPATAPPSHPRGAETGMPFKREKEDVHINYKSVWMRRRKKIKIEKKKAPQVRRVGFKLRDNRKDLQIKVHYWKRKDPHIRKKCCEYVNTLIGKKMLRDWLEWIGRWCVLGEIKGCNNISSSSFLLLPIPTCLAEEDSQLTVGSRKIKISHYPSTRLQKRDSISTHTHTHSDVSNWVFISSFFLAPT